MHVEDLTETALPHREPREQADHLVTGIEDTFLTAYRNGGFPYLMIAAYRVWLRPLPEPRSGAVSVN
ncbi:hypothetical protein AB0M68_43015 [Streptomyces sp. NPDC051453]|uniref:hypothetical protein n=1 Tax=Streptomyces sp. NPDC051453 TaxID=3154941 RepID=UPI0034283528